MDFTREQFDAVCAALGLDPGTTVSLTISPSWVFIAHSDRAATSQPITVPTAEES